MRVFAIGIELTDDMPVQRPHYADPRQHRGTAPGRDKHQGLHRRLPFRRGMLGFRKLAA
jgi:hypothetical protein